MNALTASLKKVSTPVISALLVLSMVYTVAPKEAHGAPIIFVVIAVVTTATVDYLSCGVNIVWGCDDGNGGGGGGPTSWSGSNGTKPTGGGNSGVIPGPGFGTGAGTGGSGGQDGQGSGPQACSSSANVCGMRNNSFLNTSGVCGATTPPDSVCPPPSISSFYAEPARVRKGSSSASTLHWDVTGATACSISGGGLSLSGLGISGSVQTNAIDSQTNFTLTCVEGAGPITSAQATVGLIPDYREQ